MRTRSLVSEIRHPHIVGAIDDDMGQLFSEDVAWHGGAQREGHAGSARALAGVTGISSVT